MSGIRFLYCVHREDPDGVDAEEIEVAWRGDGRRRGAFDAAPAARSPQVSPPGSRAA
jgi:hypothetical protein